MLQRTGYAILWLLLLTATPAVADDPLYLPAGSVDSQNLIPQPPSVGSPAFEQQMTVVLWLQRTRTPEQVAFVQKPLNLARFAPLIAEDLIDVDGTVLSQTLEAVLGEVLKDYDKVKATYDQPRPFLVNDAVHPATEPRPVASYPSGHAIRATVYARLLSEIFPDQQDALTDLAQQIGYGRVIAGVHYPVDVVEGQRLGNAYADVILEQPAFKEALARIRP
ncbi:MAG: phosphatase PAP2 family protein [Pseudomonadota bacterium]